MKYRIILEGEDLEQDVERFVDGAETQGEVFAMFGEEEIMLVVDSVDLITK